MEFRKKKFSCRPGKENFSRQQTEKKKQIYEIGDDKLVTWSSVQIRRYFTRSSNTAISFTKQRRIPANGSYWDSMGHCVMQTCGRNLNTLGWAFGFHLRLQNLCWVFEKLGQVFKRLGGCFEVNIRLSLLVKGHVRNF